MQKGEEHEGRPLGLTHGVGEGGERQKQALGRLARPDYAGPCGPWEDIRVVS